MYDLPGYVWVLVLAGVIGIPAAACAALYRGAIAAGLGRRAARIVAAGAAGVLGGWIALDAVLAGTGAYRQGSGRATFLFSLALVAVLTGLLAATRIPVISRILAGPGTLVRLTWPHTLRVVGVLFLIVWALDELPAAFALPAGLGDIAVGLSAPFVARRLADGTGRTRAVWFNALGVLDLVVAATIGFLAGFGPYRPLDITPTTEPLGYLPLALIPTMPVPLAVALHVVSLRRLRPAAWSAQQRAAHLLRVAG